MRRKLLSIAIVMATLLIAMPFSQATTYGQPDSDRAALSQEILQPQWDQILTVSSPAPRWLFGMAYDDRRGVVIVYGGRSATNSRFSDTWEYNGNDWIQKGFAQAPPARDRTAMVYDPDRGVVVLFGGASSGDLGDTWEYDGTRWTEVTPASSPPRRFGHAMAYDDARNVVVLFGGLTETKPPAVSDNDTWEYDGSTWVQVNTAHSPPVRSWHSMVFDSRRNVTILHGGSTGGSAFNDTWEYDGNDWVKVNTIAAPETALWGAGMAFDTNRGVTVYFRTYTWEYDGADWRFVSVAPLPETRQGHELVYDSQRAKVVLFGGDHAVPLDDTWEFSTGDCPKPLTMVTIIGATRGKVGHTYSFTAQVTPSDATTPISYEWTPAPASGQGTAHVTYRWDTPGDRSITARVENCGGSRTATHTIAIVTGPWYDSYLPLVLHGRP